MAMDRTSGNKSLEETRHAVAAARQRTIETEAANYSMTIALAAEAAAHGCCDEPCAEEYERWDGMS